MYTLIRVADKLPSVEALQERIKMLEAQLEQSAYEVRKEKEN